MEIEHWTIVVMAATASIAIAWDIYVAFFNVTPNAIDTESGIIMGWGQLVWTVPYALGVLCGHLVMPDFVDLNFGGIGILLMVGIGVAVGLFGLVGSKVVSQTSISKSLRAYGFLNLGMIMGNLFWGQSICS